MFLNRLGAAGDAGRYALLISTGQSHMIKSTAYLASACLLALAAVTASGQGKRGIRSVDFRNFSYQADGTRFVLRGGKYSEGDDAAWFSYKLADVKYLDFDSDGNDEAFVVVDYRTSGTLDNAKDYYVFSYRGGKPRMVFHEWREKPWDMRLRGRSIVIVAPFWQGGGLCCPSGLETSAYRWHGSRFVRVSRKRRYIDADKWWLQGRA
jgi:hypothetical protein